MEGKIVKNFAEREGKYEKVFNFCNFVGTWEI